MLIIVFCHECMIWYHDRWPSQRKLWLSVTKNKNFCRKQKQKNWICANCLGMTEFQSSCKIGKKIRSKDIKEQLRVGLRYITRPAE